MGAPTITFGSVEKLVFTQDESPYNKSYSDWTREWWQYHLSIPDIKENSSLSHPRNDYTPEKCSWNQKSGPVWFLPDGKDASDISTPEIRECTCAARKSSLGSNRRKRL